MAIYRQIHISFWQDEFVLNLTPEEKFFYLYLMTNSKTSQCGIYEIHKKIIQFETGYNEETIDKLLRRFIDYKKIYYDDATKEIMLVNWIKHNNNASPKVKERIKKELCNIKNKDFIERFHIVCIQYEYSIDTVCIPICNNNNNNNNNKTKTKTKDRAREGEGGVVVLSDFKTVIDTFNKNIHPITPIEAEKLKAWLEDGLEPDVIIYAIEQAALAGNRTSSYINGILLNLHAEGITTRDQAEARERDRVQQKRKKKPTDNEQQPKTLTAWPLTAEDQKRIHEADKLIAQLAKELTMSNGT